MRRLFIAAVPGDNLLQRLLAMQQALAERALILKLTPETNLHLTLRFIGACDEGLTEGVRDWFAALPQTDLAAAAGVLTGFGQFLNRDGLTVYAAVRAKAGLTALQGQLEQGLRGLGIGAETRPFVPHITLARKVKLRRALDGAEDGAGTRFVPRAVVLYESRLAAGGPSYLPLVVRHLNNVNEVE